MKPSIPLDVLHLQLINALEQECGAIAVYREALAHAGPAARWLRWRAALEEAERQEAALRAILRDLALDAERDSPGRRAVRAVGEALRGSLRRTPVTRRRAAAEECVRLLEQRERSHWELLGQLLAPGRRERTPRTRSSPHAPVASSAWLEHAAAWRLQPPAAQDRRAQRCAA